MKFVRCVVVLLLGMSRAVAAEPVPADVAKFTREFMTAVQKDGLTGMLPFLHPDAQASMKEQLMAMYRGEHRDGVIRRTFGETAKLADLEAMPPAEFLARSMATYTENTGGDPGKMIKSVEIIGIVNEGEMVYVVTRSVADVMGQKLTSVSVAPLRRYHGEWRAMLTSMVEGTPHPLTREKLPGEPPPPPPPPRR